MKKIISIILIFIMIIGMTGIAGGENIEMKSDESRVKFGIAIYNFLVGHDLRAIDSMDGLTDLLADIADAGYDGIEWYNDIFEKTYMDVKALKQTMDELGLESCSMHVDLKSVDESEEIAKAAIDRCIALGIDYLVIPYTSPAFFGTPADTDGNWTVGQIDEWVEKTNYLIDVIRNISEGTGIRIIYHNHYQEFLKCSDGKYVLENLAADGKEIDIYWAAKALGGSLSDAIDYVKTITDDVRLMHIKDGIDGSAEKNDICSWGAGDYDIQSIINIARESASIEWVIAENDTPAGTGLEDARTTAEYAAANLDFSR